MRSAPPDPVGKARGPLRIRAQHLVAIACVVAVHTLSALVVGPYAQQTADSHYNSGPFFGWVYSVAGIAVLAWAVRRFVGSRDVPALAAWLVLAGSLAGWAYRLFHLICIPCATSG